MSTKPSFLLIFLFLTSHSILSQNELRVINILGAKVYQKPNFDSEILTELPVGKLIIKEKSIKTEEKFPITKEFQLEGKWIKAEGIEGYVFSSDFSDKEVETGISEHGPKYITLLGKLLKKGSETKQKQTPQGKFPEYSETEFYENGTYFYTAWDGCFDHKTEYRNLEFHEVYHQMVSDYVLLMNGREYVVPEFIERSGRTYLFRHQGASQDLKIEMMENETITVSSYDCT